MGKDFSLKGKDETLYGGHDLFILFGERGQKL